jgi:hypothetical protein
MSQVYRISKIDDGNFNNGAGGGTMHEYDWPNELLNERCE